MKIYDKIIKIGTYSLLRVQMANIFSIGIALTIVSGGNVSTMIMSEKETDTLIKVLGQAIKVRKELEKELEG